MVVPAIEIVITNIGKTTFDDESTEDGRLWLEAFKAGARTIPGCIRACFARSDKYPDMAMHFIGGLTVPNRQASVQWTS
jgi:hypothetical protein